MAITRAKTSSVAQGPSTKKTLLGGNDVILGGSYDAIGVVDVGSGGQASVTFSSIPGTYKHLQIRFLSRDVSSASYFTVQFNGDTSASNYTWHTLKGDGASATAGGATTGTFPGAVIDQAAGAGTSIFSAGIVDILDYANTSKNTTVRSFVGFDANGSGAINPQSSLWLNTAAITSITFIYNGGFNVDQYSSFALYGIK
jgi:hypothetical protein